MKFKKHILLKDNINKNFYIIFFLKKNNHNFIF